MGILPVHVSAAKKLSQQEPATPRWPVNIHCPKKPKPTCEYCRTQLSIRHITLECPEFNGLRSILGNPTSTRLGEKKHPQRL